MIRFLVDAQLPPALVRWLTARRHHAAHVADKGMQAATDRLIWDFAVTEDWIIVAKDENFDQLKIANQIINIQIYEFVI